VPLMTCPTCGATIPIGPLAAKCNACGFNSSTVTLDDVAEALKKGAAERRAAERTRKRSPRR
jgi:hypothetical protein